MSESAIDRAAFELDPEITYFNHAAIGVLPVAARVAIGRFAEAHARRGVLGLVQYEMELHRYRARLGRFLGAGADEVAFVRNTSEAVNILARGLQLQSGDEIITNDNEFGSNVLPWLALRDHGVVVRFIQTASERMTPAVLAKHLTPKTRVVALSWVGFIDGYRHDLPALAELVHGHGALLAVDAIQGLGAFPFSMQEMDIDAVYGGAQKWLLTEPGLGYLAVRSWLVDRLHVALPGWRSLADMWDFLDYEQPYCQGAARFEGGTPNLIGMVGLMESLDLLERSGVAQIAAHVLQLVGHLREGLLRLGAVILGDEGKEVRSGILTFQFPGVDPLVTGAALAAEGIVTTNRSVGVRVSPHGYNTLEEISRFLAVMERHCLSKRVM